MVLGRIATLGVKPDPMCGIAGFITWKSVDGHRWETEARRMADAIRHRGPDDSGVWTEPNAGVVLAHRRLSILDRSPAGHQPMASACGRYVIAFNGEIYNHAQLRQMLDPLLDTGVVPNEEKQQRNWRGHSDTETLLAAVVAWGVEEALARCVGMFGFALWDRETRRLVLARDRLGEKPVYYGWQNGVFLFGSELKALRAHPAFQGEIDREALTLFLRHNYIPAPYSIYRNVCKLPPGTWLTLGSGEVAERILPEPMTYWSAKEVAEQGSAQPFAGSENEALDELTGLLHQSISGQMVADVPLGAFLSGGIDSSTIVALMQAHSARPVKTFTIGFFEEGYDEAKHARAIAAHLGTEHTELYVTPKEAMEVIPRLPSLYSEPFADSSQIPTFLVSELARRHVTVSLSGDGGDELFGGYNRYFWAMHFWRGLGWAPRPLRAAMAGVLTSFPPASWDTVFAGLARFLPAKLRYANPGDKLHKLAEVLAVKVPEEIYLGLVSQWKAPEEIIIGGAEPNTVLTDPTRWAALPDFEHRMMYLDLVSYLPDDVLVKVDRAAMGVSLESRVPLLDHRVVEFAWRLPLSMKIHRGQGKWILRELLYRRVPRALIERPKMGFGIPIDSWLRGPLRNWTENLLSESRLRQEGFFNYEPVRQRWQEHLSGKRNWQYYLWDVLMFQAWLEEESGGFRSESTFEAAAAAS